MDRSVLHVDINNCYASIECRINPALKGKCVAVTGNEEERHGIILAKNEAAKAMGVKTGETIWQAKLKCPELVTVPPHYDIYLQYSKAAHDIYDRYTDRIEPFGIDECWLDVTCTRRDIKEVADEIRETVKKELGITVSVGASFNKIFAKLGSDMKKPDGTTVILREDFREKIWGLPAADLLYVGQATAKKLASKGVKTIGQLAQTPPQYLETWLGKWGVYLYRYANGLDETPVQYQNEERAIKSISNGTTSYRDLMNDGDVKILTFALAESVASRLRKHGFKAMGVSVGIRDSKLRRFTRQCKLSSPTSDGVKIAQTAFKLYKESYDWSQDIPIRSITIGTYELCDADTACQLDLFTSPKKLEKRERIDKAVDRIRERYGYNAINRAVVATDKEFFRFDARLQNEIHPVGFTG
ncbi:DNA polymerase IV [Ruminococcus sp.]|uniref:DNA polymerase Y family protein n=1 Tax=Ruminococcus sp. TaxID=41978 RepID=UPI0025FB20A5|nr:DNA polymerase IV [Ruminococcus sp.]